MLLNSNGHGSYYPSRIPSGFGAQAAPAAGMPIARTQAKTARATARAVAKKHPCRAEAHRLIRRAEYRPDRLRNQTAPLWQTCKKAKPTSTRKPWCFGKPKPQRGRPDGQTCVFALYAAKQTDYPAFGR
jgi:hypothetical protein